MKLITYISLFITLALVSCNTVEQEEKKDIEFELVEKNDESEIEEEVLIPEAQKFYETLEPIEAFSIVEGNYPQEIFTSYIETSVTYSSMTHYFHGFSFLELNEKKIQEYDSIILFKNGMMELIYKENNDGKHSTLYKSWGSVDYQKEFKLVWPDVSFIDSLKNDTIYENDNLFYEYLKKNYSASSKKNIGYSNYGDSCTSIQEFNNQIIYTEDNGCSEEGGYQCEIHFPKIRTETARELMDILFDLKWEPISDTNTYNPKNAWVSDTKNEPIEGEGAGCYYEIEQTENRTIIKNTYCGC